MGKIDFNGQKSLEDSLQKSLEKSDYNQEHVERFTAYCWNTKNDKKKDGSLRNPWMQTKEVAQLDGLYRRVLRDGMVFDGVHITLQSTGVSYDYVAYKNKMIIVYPESTIDIGLVYVGDTFRFKKETGKVDYNHELSNPFKQEDSKVIGGYCVIKNRRGEFLTVLSKEEIEKHRAVAKTDFIWKAWFKEMVMKTLIKKACKYHFQDVYEGIEELDNENYDLDKPIKTKLETLNLEIVDLLDVYQGDDIDEIRSMCASKRQAGEFNEFFANETIKLLTPEK